MPDVACVGVMVADVLVRPVDRWPEPGRLCVVESIEVHTGGLAHTTAMTLARLGVSTAVVGRVGRDFLGGFLLDALRTHGIEVHVIQDDHTQTSATVVMVAGNGERSFLHVTGANARMRVEDVPQDLLARTRFLHLGGFFILPSIDGEPAARLLQRAQSLGCRTSLDMAWDPSGRWMTLLAPCLPHLDLLFGNRDELSCVTGAHDVARMAALLRERGVGVVVVKLGEEGSYVDGGHWCGRVPAFDVRVVDTTGAGDAFCGGFLAGLLQGWSLEQTARFANAVGALCVTAVGGSTGARSTAEVLEFMRGAPVRS
ncbi:MAG: carbohydrate kinase family protein [Armatimonadota bacterium]|nr:carbohydrate kinase family protein [Armatimonadota bacterium]MDR7550419.1 carbohydrate kinase family protein [Armatimonadota bacterium]